MNILVTGGNGQLGNSIKKISSDYPQHTFFFTDVPEVDITNLNLLDRLMEEKSVDAIINCAAYTAVDKAESDVVLAESINVAGPKNLAEAAKKRGAKLIHVSTDYVFNGTANEPLKEEAQTDPIGVYGRTKLAGEQAVKDSGCDALVIRTAWLYSEFGNNFVKTMLRLGREREQLGVVFDQVGTPTYAPDLAVAIMTLLDKGFTGFDLYHFSNEGVISWYDFTKAIFRLENINITLNPIESCEYPTPAKRPAYSVLNKKKIKSAGVSVPYWEDSLRVCLKELAK
ncbi:MAG: dTDP-4-dehydrorhamnose reductase [Paludibacteraceae bacterium]|nr:dTDP-4-dehydrorhamnose reductase [Paludibacteraceae bacterium]